MYFSIVFYCQKKIIISATLKHFESVFDHMFRLENLKATSILERYPSNIILRQILKEYVLQEFTSKVFFYISGRSVFQILFSYIFSTHHISIAVEEGLNL